MPATSQLTAADVVTAVRRRYGCETDDIGPEWAALDEMDLQPGYSTRRIDLLAIRAWRGKQGHERHAIEVKVSRADLRRELESCKWEPWAAVTHRFYLAVPADLDLSGLVLPEQWGIYTVNDRGTRRTRSAAHNHHATDLPHGVVVEAFRRASRAEARIRQADGDDLAAQVAALTRDLTAKDRQIHTARTAEERWRRRADEAMRLLAQAHPSPTCMCGTALKPLRRGSTRWEHAGAPGHDRYGRRCDWPTVDTAALAGAVLPGGDDRG